MIMVTCNHFEFHIFYFIFQCNTILKVFCVLILKICIRVSYVFSYLKGTLVVLTSWELYGKYSVGHTRQKNFCTIVTNF